KNRGFLKLYPDKKYTGQNSNPATPAILNMNKPPSHKALGVFLYGINGKLKQIPGSLLILYRVV
ncbi:hypothetical protein, partial [Eubacterium sp.]|uniref:hypothetical protein n=1 Tax=Eubacterium sp. TaxID=142586 RepID=UPI002FCC12FA